MSTGLSIPNNKLGVPPSFFYYNYRQRETNRREEHISKINNGFNVTSSIACQDDRWNEEQVADAEQQCVHHLVCIARRHRAILTGVTTVTYNRCNELAWNKSDVFETNDDDDDDDQLDDQLSSTIYHFAGLA